MTLKSLPWEPWENAQMTLRAQAGTPWDVVGHLGTLLGDFVGEIITNIRNGNGDTETM